VTAPAPGGAAPPGDPGEEARYRAARALDPTQPSQLEELLRHLADPNWRVRTAAAERIGSHPQPAAVLPALLEVATAGGSPGARNAASSALIRLGGPAVGALLPPLASDRPEVRCAAADVLGEIGDRRAALALGDLLADPNANVRVCAAEALGKVGGAYAAEALLGAAGAPDPSLRVAALDALERLGVAPPVERLRELLEDRTARRSAYRLLGVSAQPEALALLARGIADMSRGAREAAYGAVARQAAARPDDLAPLAAGVRDACAQAPSAITWANEAVAATDPLVASGAVRVLGFSGHVESALRLAAAAEEEALRPAVRAALDALGPGIAAVLRDAPARLSPPARIAVLAVLARLGERSVIPEIAAALQEPSARSAAIEALGRSGDAAAVAPLAPLLDNVEPEVAGLAAAALCELAQAGPDVRAAVLSWCRPAGEGRTPAAQLRLLGQVGDAVDVALVRRSLRDPRPATRTAAAQAFGALAARGVSAEFPPEILDALDDPQPTVRAAAASALGLAGAAGVLAGRHREDVAGALGAAMRDEVPWVRAAAAGAVGACGIERFAPDLATLVGGAEADVAASALQALARMGMATLALVVAAAAHPDPEVAKVALAAASALPGPRASGALLEGLCHARWDVRRVAARAIGERRDTELAGALRDLADVEEDPLVAEALNESLRALGA